MALLQAALPSSPSPACRTQPSQPLSNMAMTIMEGVFTCLTPCQTQRALVRLLLLRQLHRCGLIILKSKRPSGKVVRRPRSTEHSSPLVASPFRKTFRSRLYTLVSHLSAHVSNNFICSHLYFFLGTAKGMRSKHLKQRTSTIRLMFMPHITNNRHHTRSCIERCPYNDNPMHEWPVICYV